MTAMIIRTRIILKYMTKKCLLKTNDVLRYMRNHHSLDVKLKREREREREKKTVYFFNVLR